MIDAKKYGEYYLSICPIACWCFFFFLKSSIALNCCSWTAQRHKAKTQPVFSQDLSQLLMLAPLHPLYVLSFLTLFSFWASAVKSISSLHKQLSAANFAPLMGTGALCVPGQHQVGGMHSDRCSNACPFSPQHPGELFILGQCRILWRSTFPTLPKQMSF